MTTSIFSQMPPLETGVSQDLARWRSANYSDVSYKLNITLEKGAPLMNGTIEVGVKLTDEAAKNDLVLDWRTTQFGGDKDKPFAEVEKVNDKTVKETKQDGVFDYQINKEHLVVSKKYLKTGENTLLIKFASPIKTSGAGVTRYVDKEDGAEYIYSLFVPSDASTAFPIFDQPDLKARFQLNIVAPKGWKAVSNTNQGDKFYPAVRNKLSEIIDRSFYFEETKPISTYVFAFAAGEFQSFKETSYFPERKLKNLEKENFYSPYLSMKIDDGNEIFVRKSQAEKFKSHAKEVFRLNHEGVKFLESYFDYKFPFPKYDLVLIPEFPFGGMEHAGATFLRESSVIFPTEPTKNDLVSRANVIFHEAAHQWFGDTVTMKWFDDLWLKEGFAEFMAYKTLEKVMPEYNAWKIFYERNKQGAYLTDSTKGTTPIYQEIKNLSAAKSAYGNIVYRKAPSFLKQAEFYLGEKEFQIAVRSFLKKHEFKNAEWTDLVKEFETASKKDLKDWANVWVKQRGVPRVATSFGKLKSSDFSEESKRIFKLKNFNNLQGVVFIPFGDLDRLNESGYWGMKFEALVVYENDTKETIKTELEPNTPTQVINFREDKSKIKFVFPNYQDYGYGIFLLDEKSRAYVLANIQTEKDDFLRAMMWGSLWDSVRETELAPADYVELVIKNINVETDESTIQTLLGRVSTAMNYYIPDEKTQSVPPASAGGSTRQIKTSNKNSTAAKSKLEPSADADGTDKAALAAKVEKLLIEKFQTASTVGQKITYFRALQSIGSGDETRKIFKDLLNRKGDGLSSPATSNIGGVNGQGQAQPLQISLKTKDKFDLVTRLLILGDKDAPAILARLEKTETSDEAKRYAYAAKAGIASAENKQKFWNDFAGNKEISESWIEAAFAPFNSIRHSELTLPFLEKALAELPNLKKNRKIFFVNGWLASFIGGQKSEQALEIVNKFLAENPNLDRDLKLKILENADNLERAVKIRAKYGQ